MAEVTLKIQGSRPSPYTVSIKKGIKYIRFRCSCPQGSRKGEICKHIKALFAHNFDAVVNTEALPDALPLIESIKLPFSNDELQSYTTIVDDLANLQKFKTKLDSFFNDRLIEGFLIHKD